MGIERITRLATVASIAAAGSLGCSITDRLRININLVFGGEEPKEPIGEACPSAQEETPSPCLPTFTPTPTPTPEECICASPTPKPTRTPTVRFIPSPTPTRERRVNTPTPTEEEERPTKTPTQEVPTATIPPTMTKQTPEPSGTPLP